MEQIDAADAEVKLSEKEQEQLKEIVKAEQAEIENEDTESKSSKRDMLRYVTQAAREGLISVHEKNRLRAELGIFQSDYTRKQANNKRRKAKRKQQKKARRKNR